MRRLMRERFALVRFLMFPGLKGRHDAGELAATNDQLCQRRRSKERRAGSIKFEPLVNGTMPEISTGHQHSASSDAASLLEISDDQHRSGGVEGCYTAHAKLEICRLRKPGKKRVTRYQHSAGLIAERRADSLMPGWCPARFDVGNPVRSTLPRKDSACGKHARVTSNLHNNTR